MLRRVRPALLVTALALPCLANAFTANIAPGGKSLYLRVGDGRFTAEPYCGTDFWSRLFFCAWPVAANWEFDPGAYRNGNFATVSATVPAATLGNGTPVTMSADTADGQSHYDDRPFCAPGDLYVGGFYRRPGNTPFVAELAINVPPVLTNAAGDTIPISEIFWTSTEAALPGRSLASGNQIIAQFPANVWQESCQRFFYRNTTVPAPGTYRATVIYTLSTP